MSSLCRSLPAKRENPLQTHKKRLKIYTMRHARPHTGECRLTQKADDMFNIVLVEPEIPQNTGNIARTCAATGCTLHLVKPLGFEISDRYLKRAGLDYWHLVDVKIYENFEELCQKHPGARFRFYTTKARRRHTDADYREGDFLVFGRETRGLDEELLLAHPDECVRIPMIGEARSLNLSNAAAVAVYEALRQTGFDGLESAGNLHRHSWEEAKGGNTQK